MSTAAFGKQNQIPFPKTAVMVMRYFRPFMALDETLLSKVTVLSQTSAATPFAFVLGTEKEAKVVELLIHAHFTNRIKVLATTGLRPATRYLSTQRFESVYYVTTDSEWFYLNKDRSHDYELPSGFLKKFTPVTISTDRTTHQLLSGDAVLRNLAASGDYKGFFNLMPSWQKMGRGKLPIPTLFNQVRQGMNLPPLQVKEGTLTNLVTCSEGSSLAGTFCYKCIEDAEATGKLLGIPGTHVVTMEGEDWFSPGVDPKTLKNRIFQTWSPVTESMEIEDPMRILNAKWTQKGKDYQLKWIQKAKYHTLDFVCRSTGVYTVMLTDFLDIEFVRNVLIDFTKTFQFNDLVVESNTPITMDMIERLGSELSNISGDLKLQITHGINYDCLHLTPEVVRPKRKAPEVINPRMPKPPAEAAESDDHQKTTQLFADK